MSRYYNMDGRPITLTEWIALVEGDFETSRRVAEDECGGVRVSTVLLGLDHGYGEGPPLIFETMIFGGRFDGDEPQWRYSTREQAEAQDRT